MKLNSDTSVLGTKVTLIPYLKGHVLKYHEWMCDEEMLFATASDPLSLEEEYKMQESWSIDEEKITFIILDATDSNKMVGDVNCFLNDRGTIDTEPDKTIAEIEIMIAEPSAKRKGLATEALQLMMLYCRQHLGIRRFYAKIGEENKASLALFKSDNLGYTQCNYAKAFQEFELELLVQPFDLDKEAGANTVPYAESSADKTVHAGDVRYADISGSTDISGSADNNVNSTTEGEEEDGKGKKEKGCVCCQPKKPKDKKEQQAEDILSDLLDEVILLVEENKHTETAAEFVEYVESMLPTEILQELQIITGMDPDDVGEEGDTGFLHTLWKERYRNEEEEGASGQLYSFIRTGCACCERDNVKLTRHHLYPKETHKACAKKGITTEQLNSTITICRLCHTTIHRFFTNQQLALNYHSLELLLDDERFSRFAQWNSKQSSQRNGKVR